jgi:hypothetical protein
LKASCWWFWMSTGCSILRRGSRRHEARAQEAIKETVPVTEVSAAR